MCGILSEKDVEMFNFYRLNNYNILRWFIFCIMTTVFLNIYPPHSLAQSMTEYLTLQTQVQGEMQKGTVKDEPAREEIQSFEREVQPNSEAESGNFLSGLIEKFTPLRMGIIIVFVVSLWLLINK